ncbi:putative porin [Anaerophaga thermohalophila]|uniref:putative porin n=1 Tax=Anaerophaga thermohalophila TaxID=177400 RepID=UPI000237BF06|nr:putative porin [Anaerophaga thermohalophila]
MKKLLLINIFLIFFQMLTNGQIRQIGRQGGGSPDGFGQNPFQTGQSSRGNEDPRMGEDPERGSQQPTIPREVKNWRLVDDYGRSDTVAVDTTYTGFQIYNPIYQRSIVNLTTGNLGAPAKSMLVEDMPVYNTFLFSRHLNYWLSNPEEWKYYNTRTPYTNIYYQHSGPKRRSEENVAVLFTQNINEDWNFGFNYKLISSVGKYEAQKADNRFFRFFSSYSGEKYSVHGSFFYGKTDQLENGGLLDDDPVFNPEKYDYGQPENIPVIFMDASSRIDNYKVFLNQKLDIGKISIAVNDSVSRTEPLATLGHTFELDRYRRTYHIDDLSGTGTGEEEVSEFYPVNLIDDTRTRDSVYHNTLRNIVQLQFNEEANPFLRFGMRVLLVNEIENLQWPAPSGVNDETDEVIYHHNSERRTATAIGGQLFKNQGENFFYDAGMKVWFQGHKSGDSEITGGFNSLFRIRKDTAGFFARGGIYLSSPGFYTEHYYSNHFEWDQNFDPEKTVKIRGGINIPTRRLQLSGEVRLINDYIYWNEDALPEQTNEVLNLVEIKLKKHFEFWNLHSRNEVAYQITTNDRVAPLPEIALFSSNYYENILFGVLHFQLGFDLRYHTAYYAPDYMPATGQFFIQRERKAGNYPVIDLFANFHLKRANIFVKYDHINQGWPDNNYFHTIGYPINPGGLRYGVSWNFYD